MQIYLLNEFPEFDYIGTNHIFFEFNKEQKEDLENLISISLKQNKYLILANENSTEKRKK